MTTFLILLSVLVAGGFGGVVNSALTGEMKLPHLDRQARVFRPGWTGTMLVGAVSALVSWGVYGPSAKLVLLGAGPASDPPSLLVGQICGAVLIGIGGGRWLTAEIDRLVHKRERDALALTKDELTKIIGNLTGTPNG